MDYMFAPGFLDTRAPFYMDMVTLIVALLPFLIGSGIYLARKGFLKVHISFQIFLFLFSVILVGYFEYGVRMDGGYAKFAIESSIPQSIISAFLFLHIIISIVGTIWWGKTVILGIRDYLRKDLPGVASAAHIRNGWISAVAIFLIAISGVWVYLSLFVF